MIDRRPLDGRHRNRPLRTEATAAALSASVMKSSRPGVSVYPGLNTLTRMSRPLRSTIQVRANERTAAFDALYTEQEAKPLIETIEPVRITEDPRASNGSAFCTVNNRPRTSVLNVL